MVIFLLALTVLLGFTALAIDGGMIYADRRLQQSAADSASMAAAGTAAQYMDQSGITDANFDCSTNAGVTAALSAGLDAAVSRAAANGVTGLGYNTNSGNHRVFTDCDSVQKTIEFTTIVTSNVATSFLQLFYNGPVQNTVSAQARVHPRSGYANGNAIVALAATSGNGILLNGDVKILSTGGGLFSNSFITITGSDFSVDAPSVNYMTSLVAKPNFTNNGVAYTPSQATSTISVSIPAPTCGNSPAVPSNGGTLDPGNYTTISGNVSLNPGLYCVSGSLSGSPTGSGVTIYFTGSNSGVDWGAQNQATLSASDNNAVNGALPGILFYADIGNTGGVNMLEGSVALLGGIIYMPSATFEMDGNTMLRTPTSGPSQFTQIIASAVNSAQGTPDILITYNLTTYNSIDPSIDLMQ